MQHTVLIAHVVIGMLFILCVLIQDKGTGLSAALGGGGGFYASQRGAAKVIHYVTVVLCVAFFGTALGYVLLPAAPEQAQPKIVNTSSEPVTVAPSSTPTPSVPVQATPLK